MGLAARACMYLILLIAPVSAYSSTALKNLTIGAQRKLHNASFAGLVSWQTTPDANIGFGLVVVEIDYFRATGSTVTSVLMQCSANISFFGGGEIDHFLQTCVMSSGNCSSVNSFWSKPVSIYPTNFTVRWVWRLNVQGYDNIKCEMLPFGGFSGNDTISVHTKITAF